METGLVPSAKIKTNTQDSGLLSLQACQVLEVQINDQVGTGALFYAEVFLSPQVAFAILPVRASLSLDSPCSANTPTHELGVLPAAALPILTEHTVLLETLNCTETRATVTCWRAGLHGQPPPPHIRPAECAASRPIPNLACGSGIQVPKQAAANPENKVPQSGSCQLSLVSTEAFTPNGSSYCALQSTS